MNFTLNSLASATYKEKRSEFISFAKPIYVVDDVNNFVRELKSKYPAARHICWTYRLNIEDQIIENYTDAGEPSGSAGLPILNILKHHNLVNCSIFIVRIYGGVQLGKQGLINAYKTTAELVIAESVKIKWIPKADYVITGPINYFGKIVHILQKNGGKIISDRTLNELNLLVEIPTEKFEKFRINFNEVTQNSGKIKKQSERDQTKEVRK